VTNTYGQTQPVAAAEGCVRRRSRRKTGHCGVSGKPRWPDWRRLCRRTQPSAAATKVHGAGRGGEKYAPALYSGRPPFHQV